MSENKNSEKKFEPHPLDPSKVDPSLTIDVKNPEVEEWVKTYSNEKTGENLNQLIEKIRVSRILVPATLNEQKQPLPCQIKNPDGDMLLPIFTSKEQIPAEPKSPIVMNVPYLAMNELASKEETKLVGIVINPFTDNLVFKKKLIDRIQEVEKVRREAGVQKTMQLTPEQYMVFERRQFEFGFLPKRFFEKGMEMIEELQEKKEACIDELFEEAYQQKRMYPYLPEDFSVMAMNLSDEFSLVRVDLPDRDFAIPSCIRVYFAWDAKKEQGRYLTIERSKDKRVNIIGEIGMDWKHVSHGEAPVEGAELARVLELVQGEQTEEVSDQG